MALTKLDKNLLGFSDDTDFVKLPSGTTAQRPGSPAAGQFRFNTTIGDAEVYDGTAWQRMGIAPPTFSSVDYPGDDTALDPAGGQSLIINGSTFNTGVTVTIDGTTPSSITRNSATQLTVTAPAKSAGTYTLVITNTDGGTSTSSNAVSYNGIPAFTNAAGSLGSVGEGETANFSAAATEPDGGAIGYTITSGALPTGLSINASTGAITGTAGSVSADTTSNFTVTATDNENQSTARAYSITVTNASPANEFKVVTYTGNGSTTGPTVTVGFQPDMIWIKRRDSADAWYVYDSTRDTSNPRTKILLTNDSTAELDNTSYYSLDFLSNGFQPKSSLSTATNANGGKYVAYCFKANGGTTTNNSDGTITTAVQTNTSLGFSIIKWTGNGTAGATIGHNLGAVPEMFIVKKRSSGTTNWRVYHKNSHASTPEDYNLELNGATPAEDRTEWNDTAPTSSVFSVSSHDSVNENGSEYIAYAFADKTGFLKSGSYTGNGNDWGPIVTTGFEPAFLMIKVTSTTDSWFVVDNQRDTNNSRLTRVFPNSNAAEASEPGAKVDFLTNGFQIRGSGGGQGQTNSNGHNYIYLAIAAAPNTVTPTKANSFKAKTYTGNGSTNAITGLGFKPDLVWTKERNGTNWHTLHDVARGINARIHSNSTNAEDRSSSTALTSFDSGGFTLGSNSNENTNGNTYVSWNWKAGGLPTYNTSGNINAFVSANVNAGFSVVRWKGNENASQTLPHGLGTAPELAIIKQLDGTRAWTIPLLLSGYSTGNVLEFDSDALTDDNNKWSAVGSDYLTVGASPFTNSNGSPMIGYFFRSITGFSKIGYYSGTGGSSRSFTGLGFQPDFIMIKCTSAGSTRWHIYDSARGAAKRLLWNSNGTEFNEVSAGNDGLRSFDSDGWTVGNDGDLNGSGRTFLYMAFKHLT
tara:strand:+ start:774 stop:3530 length:2757 start_codon:yes stop_codon:yes gene_type:complete